MSPISTKTAKGSNATLWRRRGDNVSAEETGCQGTTWWTRGCVGERLVLQGFAVLWRAGTEVAVREHTPRGVTHAPRRRHWRRSNLAMMKGGRSHVRHDPAHGDSHGWWGLSWSQCRHPRRGEDGYQRVWMGGLG